MTKPLKIGVPGSPDGPPLEPKRTLAYRLGYWGTWTLIVVIVVTISAGLGRLFVHLTF